MFLLTVPINKGKLPNYPLTAPGAAQLVPDGCQRVVLRCPMALVGWRELCGSMGTGLGGCMGDGGARIPSAELCGAAGMCTAPHPVGLSSSAPYDLKS